jgi:hypothetical protein
VVNKKLKVVEKQKNKISLTKIFILSIVASILLLVTNSAFWINKQIFNTTNFTSAVTTSLTSESSRVAMAERITDRIFADRAIARRVAGNLSTQIVSGILATDQFTGVLDSAVTRLHTYASSSNQENIDIDLTGIKDIIVKVTNASEALGKDITIRADNVPDTITIIEESKIPDFYRLGVVFLWMAPVAFIFAVLLLAYPHLKYRNDTKSLLILQATIITLVGLFGLLFGPLFKPPVLSSINEPSGRIIVSNIYDSFISTFNSQTLVMVSVGIIALFIGLFWYLYPTLKNIIRTNKN